LQKHDGRVAIFRKKEDADKLRKELDVDPDHPMESKIYDGDMENAVEYTGWPLNES